jgi:rubrerythrin
MCDDDKWFRDALTEAFDNRDDTEEIGCPLCGTISEEGECPICLEDQDL